MHSVLDVLRPLLTETGVAPLGMVISDLIVLQPVQDKPWVRYSGF